MKKYFYNFYLILININNYGIITIFKALIIEFFYLLKIRDFQSYIHDEKYTSSYVDTKKNKNYSTQHTPTPYYFLKFVENFLKKKCLDNFILVDLGCGYGRVGKFFINKFNCLFYGLEINEKFIETLKSEKKYTDRFILNAIDLKDQNKRSKIFDQIIFHKKKIVFFISDPFDIKTIVGITQYFKDTQHYVVAINIKEIHELLKKYNIVFSKEFKTKSRHIMLLELNNEK